MKKGTILNYENNSEDHRMILAVLDNNYLLSRINRFAEAESWYTKQEIEKQFDIPLEIITKQKWRPTEYREYYYHITSCGVVDKTYLVSSCYEDTERLKIGNCFSTREEARQMADKFKALLNE